MQWSSVWQSGGWSTPSPPGLDKKSSFKFRSWKPGGAVLCLGSIISGLAIWSAAAAPQPMVAIHDSELTRALDGLPAVNASTPTGVGTSGFEWWPTNWHYFVMPESVKEALRSDGTAFEVLGDADIIAGKLLDTNGQPRYPIFISLASEAIGNEEIAPLTNYVAAGGFAF